MFPAKTSPIRYKWVKKISRLEFEQKHLITVAFLFWLIPVVAIYLLGWVYKWIINGFKKRS